MLRFHNTLSRKKEDFVSIEKNVVKIYSCGPTVYSFQHLGNMRAALFVDLLKRSLSYFNYKVISVQNITDVGHLVSDDNDGEDKMLKASKKEKKDPYEVAEFYTNKYLDDLKKLNVKLAEFMPKATDHIKEQIKIISELEQNDFTYITDDGVYFDTSKFKEYGSLSKQKLQDKKAGARIKVDTHKKNPQDFALWKFLTGDNKEHIMKWESPWGVGFPGWHIECSAMSHKYLGSEFDIHTGGIEHIPIHHENEIAQNTCSGSVKRINFWMHNAHMLMDSEKMSKSIGNIVLVDDLEKKKINPLAFRIFCFQTHYRQQLNFTWDAIQAAQNSLEKIQESYRRLKNLKAQDCEEVKIQKFADKCLDVFEEALKDDLNSAKALASLFDFISEINKHSLLCKEEKKVALDFFERVNIVFGVLEEDNIPQEVLELARRRQVARKKKDFEKSDELRDEIKKKGYEVKDSKTSKEGFILSKI